MNSPKVTIDLRKAAAIFIALGLLLCTIQSISAQRAACDLLKLDENFEELSNKINEAEGDVEVYTEVFNSTLRYVDEAFKIKDPYCAAKGVFGAVNVASQIPNGHLITQYTADSIYAFTTQSTDSADLAFFLFSAGILEFSRGDRAAARIWFDSTLSIPRELHSNDSYASTLKVRGFVNKYDKRYDDALSDFALAEYLYAKHHDDLKAQIDIASARAEVQVLRGDKPEAVLPSIEKAIKLYEENDEQFTEWRDAYNIYTSYARILSGLGRFEDAENAGNTALKITEKSGDQFRTAIVHGTIAGQLVHSNRLKEARKHALKSYEDFESISKQSHMAETLEQLVRIETKLGAYKTALGYSNILVAVRDSLYQNSQVHEIRKLQQIQAQNAAFSALALERANGRMLIAEQSEARMKLLSTIAAIGIFLVLVVFVLFYRLRAKRKTHQVLEKLVESRTAELQKHAKSLEEKNTELERFAFIASHDLKTPLRNITSFIDLAERRMSQQTKSEIGEYLDIASSYAKQMDYVICDVLEFSKIERKQIQLKSLNQLRFITDKAIKISLPEFEQRNPSVSVDGNEELLCDSDCVEQVLCKLIHNALKFNDSVIPRVNIQITKSNKDFVEIRVSDNGVGIEQEYGGKIFDLFRRLNLQEKYPGTGLGLSIARKLARRMGGDVCLEQSSYGNGSTFLLRLPIMPPISKNGNTAVKEVARLKAHE